MPISPKLKKRAAEFELKKQFDKALELYVQILQDSGRDLADDDVPLYNRVGDILMRQGRVSEALSYYEHAVDVYAERGYLNNAIALCSKILRQSPGRTAVYYKLGKISANKGFKSDARKNFLEYAERMQKSGNLDEAFRALKEFAALYPDQDDIRLILAEQLSREHRKGEALEQLQELYSKFEREGRSAEARATIDRMQAIDPDVVPRMTGPRGVEKHNELVFLDLSDAGAPPRVAPTPTPISRPRRVTAPQAAIPALEGLTVTFVPDEETVVAPDESVAHVDGFEATSAVADAPSPAATGIESGRPAPETGAPPSGAAAGNAGNIGIEDIHPVGDAEVDLEVEPVPGLEHGEGVAEDAGGDAGAGVAEDSGVDASEDAGEDASEGVAEDAGGDASEDAGPRVADHAPRAGEPLSGSEFGELALSDHAPATAERAHDLALPAALPLLGRGESARNSQPVAAERDDVRDAVPGTRAPDGAAAVDDTIDPGGEGVESDPAAAETFDDTEAVARDGSAPVVAVPMVPGAVDARADAGERSDVPGGEPAGDGARRAPAALQGEGPADDLAAVREEAMLVSEWPAGLAPVELPGDAEPGHASDVASREGASGPPAAFGVPLAPHSAAEAREEIDEDLAELFNAPPSFGVREYEPTPIFTPIPGLSYDEEDGEPDIELVSAEEAGANGEVPDDEAQRLLEARARANDDGAAAVAVSEGGASTEREVRTPRSTVSLGGAEQHLRRRLELEPGNWALRRQLGEALFDAGDREGGLYELELAMVGFEQSAELDHASEVANEIIRVVPTSVRHHQKRVEYAVRAKDRPRLIEAYLELADALFRTGEAEKSVSVYTRVLELSPQNDRAVFALATLAPDLLARLRGAPARAGRWSDELEAIADAGPLAPAGEAAAADAVPSGAEKAAKEAEPVSATASPGESGVPSSTGDFAGDSLARDSGADGSESARDREEVEVTDESSEVGPAAVGELPAEEGLDAEASPGDSGPAPLESTESADVPEATPAAPATEDDAHETRDASATPVRPIEVVSERRPRWPFRKPAFHDRAPASQPAQPEGAGAPDGVPPSRAGALPPEPAPAPTAPRAPAPHPVGSNGGFIDLGEWLRDGGPMRSTRMVVEGLKPTGDEQADFEEMLRRFKRGIAENVDEEDFDAHYDLGVAYKEMGLVDEAIAEFQKALRGREQRVRAYEALGQCFVEKEQFSIAAALLQRAAEMPGVEDQQLVGVLYLLGFACEQTGRHADALRYYQRVFAVDIRFRDISTRISTMELSTK